MKKILAIMMSHALVLAFGAMAFAATEADLAELEFDPNPDYDMWTVVEFTIESIGVEDMPVTVSAKEDLSEFYLECNFYGDDQMTRTTYNKDAAEGEQFEVLEDKTGFMKGDTPTVLQMAIDQDLWVKLGAAEGATEADLPAEPEFDPNEDYAFYTVVEFSIESIGVEDMPVTVSANEDFTEFYLECNFYGDDQMTRTSYDKDAAEGEQFEVLEDKTGFMKGDTPAVLQMALDQDIWVPVA
ncbi:MAG: hypothetical protein IJ237_05705 [Oscillospiraceae bacterium]|nr:hypothetical protein [Oscillospiraceae bacterium]